MARISVIIPTFNRKHLLAATLDNILHQSMPPHEIIVVDDHSTDGTEEFIKHRYQNKVIIMANEGRGPGAARNRGMKVASGDYIKFFDSDDLMTLNMLEAQYLALSNSSKEFVYSPYMFAKQDTNGTWTVENDLILNYFPFNNKFPLWHFMIMDGLFITIPGMLFKKSLLDKVGAWREDVTASEDWDYLFRISMIEPNPIHTNACSFLYRLHGGQTTGGHFSDVQRDQDKITVLTDLYELGVQKDTRFSVLHRTIFLNKFYQVRRMMKGNERVNLWPTYHAGWQRLVWLFLRLRLKTGRAKTNTDWQPCHGPLISKKNVDNYLNLL